MSVWSENQRMPSNLGCVHISNVVVREGPRFWLGEQADGAGGRDLEAQTLVSVRG